MMVVLDERKSIRLGHCHSFVNATRLWIWRQDCRIVGVFDGYESRMIVCAKHSAEYGTFWMSLTLNERNDG